MHLVADQVRAAREVHQGKRFDRLRRDNVAVIIGILNAAADLAAGERHARGVVSRAAVQHRVEMAVTKETGIRVSAAARKPDRELTSVKA